ncbi:MAG: beta-N-acetylhexosaminidase [Candidatus Limiplasma sp.]|nr:beta-N-acetylhexosaminidase [Candidatus Limiplasma sp.]MEA5145811.1 beta-N-acetylhexosaminidase [Candidatus Limiplasma sp.]
MDERIAIGQHFFTGFAGPTMTDAFIQNVREQKIGNAILFEYNVGSKDHLAQLCAEIRTLILSETGHEPLIALDQEGGAISRLTEDSTIFPSAMGMAATGNPDLARMAGRITAQELRAMGVNLNLAPVLDVNSNPQNPVIGIRSYGDDPLKVAKFGLAMAEGLAEGGILSCVKHFPGHGDTAVDSHIGLPLVAKTMEDLASCELLPFRSAIQAGIPAVMTAHILFPELEPDQLPATMSRRIISGLLKQQMGFQGLVLSDCLMMDAIAKEYGEVVGSVAAVRAGVDMVFISHDAALAAQGARAVQQALRDGTLNQAEFDASTQKILAVKASLAPASLSLADVGCAEHRQASLRATHEALTLVHPAPFTLGKRPLFLGCSRFRPTLAANPEDETQRFPMTMQALLGGDALLTPADPTPEDIQAALACAQGHSAVVIGLFNALQCEGQRRLVAQAAKLGIPVCAVALRAPYDLAGLPDAVRTYAIYDYDVRTMVAFADGLRGKNAFTGKLPVHLPASQPNADAPDR